MLAGAILALLLTAAGQSTDNVSQLGPSRRIDGMLQSAPAPQPPPVAPVTSTPRSTRISIKVGGYAGLGAPYQSYPLPSGPDNSSGFYGAASLRFNRAYVEAEALKRISSRGFSADVMMQIRVATMRGLAVSIVGQSYTGSSGDLIYRGPSDVGLGMKVLSNVFQAGAAFRFGAVDYPAMELTLIGGASRFEQTPELWVGGSPFSSRDPLTQITRNPVYTARVKSSAHLGGRIRVSGSLGYTGWVGNTSTLLPAGKLEVRGRTQFTVTSWCLLDADARWASDNRGPALSRSALMLGLTFRK